MHGLDGRRHDGESTTARDDEHRNASVGAGMVEGQLTSMIACLRGHDAAGKMEERETARIV